jgi:hypothetical protein
VHPRGQWLLSLQYARRLQRSAPKLHGGCGGSELHMQHGSNLLEHRRCLRELHYVDDVCAGRAGVLLQLGKLALRSTPELRRAARYGGVLLQDRSCMHLDE